MNRKSNSRQLLAKRIVKRDVLVMVLCERCCKANRQCIVSKDCPKCSQYIQNYKLCDLWISEAIWRFINRVKSKLNKNVEKNRCELKELLNEQRHHIEKHNQFFRENNRKFEKRSLKALRLDKMRRHLDKREKTSLIQDSDLLDLLNSLNSDQETLMIQRSSGPEHLLTKISFHNDSAFVFWILWVFSVAGRRTAVFFIWKMN